MPTRAPAAVAWVVAALLVGFAPLFHAICIAPLAASASGEVMVHTMADRTVMSSASFVNDERPDVTSASFAAAATIDPDGLSDPSATLVGAMSGVLLSIGDIGMILVVVGLAVLTMIVFARWRELAGSFGHPPPVVALARARPVVAAWPRSAVDLDALGISRT